MIGNLEAIKAELAELGGLVSHYEDLTASPPAPVQVPLSKTEPPTAMQSMLAMALKAQASIVHSKIAPPASVPGRDAAYNGEAFSAPTDVPQRPLNYVNPARRSMALAASASGNMSSTRSASGGPATSRKSTASGLKEQLRTINRAQMEGFSSTVVSSRSETAGATSSMVGQPVLSGGPTGDNLYARAEVYRLKKEEARRREEEAAKQKAKPQLNA